MTVRRPPARRVTGTRPPVRVRSAGGPPRSPKPPPAQPRTRLRALPSLLALLVTLGLLGAALGGVVRVHRVVVVGAGLPVTTIVQTSGVIGQNIFLIRRDQVIARLAGIRSIEVSRVETSLPDRVTIYATLRRPYGAWREAGVTHLLDEAGNVIGETTSTALPLIVSNGRTGPPGYPQLAAVHYAAQVLPPAPDGKLAAPQLDARHGLVIAGRSGWHAVLGTGTAQELVNRVATLGKLLITLAGQGQQLLYADLHFRGGYYCRRGVPCQSIPAQFGGSKP